MNRLGSAALALLAVVQLSLAPGLTAMAADGPALQAGTRLYLTLDENVSSARGGDDVGTVVRCRVWRDVEDRGVVFIKAGTPAICRVSKVSRRNMGGTEGKIAIDGVEAHSVDGQALMLAGGYNKVGAGHKAVVWTVGILLLWPVLFVPGGNAELPPGTVFDVSTVNELRLAGMAEAPRKVNLTGLGGPSFSAEFMLDEFLAQPKHDTFRIKVGKDGQFPKALVIDSVNSKSVEAMPLTVTEVVTKDGDTTAVASIGAKALAKHFARGINRFEVAYTEDGQRHATEVIMDVQM